MCNKLKAQNTTVIKNHSVYIMFHHKHSQLNLTVSKNYLGQIGKMLSFGRNFSSECCAVICTE